MKLVFLYFVLFQFFPCRLSTTNCLQLPGKAETTPEMKKSFSLKNISTCSLAVACLFLLSIPVFVYILLRRTSKQTEFTLDNAELTLLWSRTTVSMNSTFNCLIFYWKNKALRTEGMKVIKSMKICRRVQSCSAHTQQADNNGV